MAATAKTVVVFRVGGELCALPVSAVAEVLHMAQVARPPGLPRILEGFLDIDGRAHAVLRLDRLFGLAETPLALYTPLLILRDAQPPLALLAEAVTGVLAAEEVVPIEESGTFNGCVVGEARTAAGPAHLLATERILLEHEQRLVEEFQDRLLERQAAATAGEPAP